MSYGAGGIPRGYHRLDAESEQQGSDAVGFYLITECMAISSTITVLPFM